MTAPAEVLNPEVLKTQSALNDDQRDALYEEAVKEREKDAEEKPEEKTPEEKTEEKPAEEDKAPEPEKEKDTQKSPEELKREALEKTNKEILEKPEKDLTKDELAKRVILVKQKDEAELSARVDVFAKEKNIPAKQAREELESYRKIAEKYQKDPEKMAQAMLGLQREYNATREELKKIQTAPRQSDLKHGEAIINGKKLSAPEVREILIEGYRKENPAITEDMEDDKVFQLAVVRIKEKQAVQDEAYQNRLVITAKEKRSKVLSEVSEDDKDYVEEIEGLINETPDHVIVDQQWDYDAVKNWARGRYFTNDRIEEIRKEAFKKGQEEAEILGLKEKETPPQGKAPSKGKSVSMQLTADEKTRALEMYRTEGLTDEQKFEMYIDFKNHTSKK
jgi:hypothetical protein